MFTSMDARSRRRYVQRRRAERTDETRARILEAVITLHRELRPCRTTITALPPGAGVQRLPACRPFPAEERSYLACPSRWFAAPPLPAPALWTPVADPAAATRIALRHLFAYHRATSRMWSAYCRDVEQLPALQPH